MSRKPREHYQVVITSGTDARKKPVSFSLSRRTIVIIIAVFFLVIAVCLVFSLTAFREISASQIQIEDLTQKIESQSKLLEEYAAQITGMQNSLQAGGSKTVSNPVTKSSVSKGSPILTLTGLLAETKMISDKGLSNLVWPFQDTDSGYDADWPGPDGYYHAPRDGGEIHEGVDICAVHDTPIFAVINGTVVSNGWNNDGGWMVEIQSAEGYIFRYLHLAAQSSLALRTGAEAGVTVVGYCGDTGGDYPDHLHLSIYLPDRAETIDPTPFLKSAEERYKGGE